MAGRRTRARDNLRRVGRAAEEAGFDTISVMDHVVQIPTVGPEWEDIPESTTALAFLAAATERVQLGALVNGITYRNLTQLGKQVATLDVLSGGRAFCGLGVAWHEREHVLYGWDLPPLAERYDRLEDALELFPLAVGPGRAGLRGPHHHRSRSRLLPAAAAGAPPDPRRWVGRAPHPSPGGAPR